MDDDINSINTDVDKKNRINMDDDINSINTDVDKKNRINMDDDINSINIDVDKKNKRKLSITDAKEKQDIFKFRNLDNGRSFVKKNEKLVKIRKTDVISKIHERELSTYVNINQVLKQLITQFDGDETTKYIAKQLKRHMGAIVLSIATENITNEQIKNKIKKLEFMLKQQHLAHKHEDLIGFAINIFVNNNEISRELQDIEDDYKKLNRKYDRLYSGEADGRTKFFFKIDEDYNEDDENKITRAETNNLKNAHFIALLFENINSYFNYLDNEITKKNFINTIIQSPLMKEFLQQIANSFLEYNKNYTNDDELIDDIIRILSKLETLSYDEKVNKIKEILNEYSTDDNKKILETIMDTCKQLYQNNEHYIPANNANFNIVKTQYKRQQQLHETIKNNRINFERSLGKNSITAAFRNDLKPRHNIDRKKMQEAIASIIAIDGDFNNDFTEANKGFLGWLKYGGSKILSSLPLLSKIKAIKALPKKMNNELITKLTNNNVDLREVVYDYCNIIEYIQVNKNNKLLKHNGAIDMDILKSEIQKLKHENNPILEEINTRYRHEMDFYEDHIQRIAGDGGSNKLLEAEYEKAKEIYFAKTTLLHSLCNNSRSIAKTCNNYNKRIEKEHPIMDDYAIGHNIITFMAVLKLLGVHIDTKEMNRLKEDVIGVLNKNSEHKIDFDIDKEIERLRGRDGIIREVLTFGGIKDFNVEKYKKFLRKNGIAKGNAWFKEENCAAMELLFENVIMATRMSPMLVYNQETGRLSLELGEKMIEQEVNDNDNRNIELDRKQKEPAIKSKEGPQITAKLNKPKSKERPQIIAKLNKPKIMAKY